MRRSPPFRFGCGPAPAGCPEKAAVVARVGDLVGPSSRAEDDLWFEADVAPLESGRWRAVLKSGWAGSSSERRFESASCASIASATAFIIAMSLDPAASPSAPRASRARLATRAPSKRNRKNRRLRSPPAKLRRFISRSARDDGRRGLASETFARRRRRDHDLARTLARRRVRSGVVAAADGGQCLRSGREIGLVTGELRGCASILRTGARAISAWAERRGRAKAWGRA